MQYEYSYSLNGGSSWTVIGSLTSAGVTSKSWSTSGLAATTQAKIRVRAWDGTAFGPYSTGSNFTLAAETTPPAPTGLSPNTSFPAQLRTATIRLAWTHGGGAGNPQTAYSGEWSYNANMSGATAFSASSANQFHDITANTFNHGATVYWRVKTTGLTLQSAFSAIASFVAANAPATPTITAPTAGSPPTESRPTITFTHAAGELAKRRLRVEISGVEVYTESYVSSTATSFVSPYPFADGVAATLFLSIQNQYGINSSEDSEAVTPAYSGPAQPTIDVTNIDDSGYIQIVITNSDTPDYNHIYRRLTSESAGNETLIADSVPVDGVFRDYNIKSGTSYTYFARAVNAPAGVIESFTDSATDSATLNLSLLWVHLLTKASPSANASGTPVGLINPDGLGQLVEDAAQRRKKCRGRSLPVAVYGQHTLRRFTSTCMIQATEESKLNTLRDIYATNTDVCVRDQTGLMIFGRMITLREACDYRLTLVTFTVAETDYDETA